MKTDLKYMHTEIMVLKQQILDLVLLKFGKVLSVSVIDEHLEKKTFGDDIVNDLMEALLRKMVHELRLSLADVKSLYKDEMILWEVRKEKVCLSFCLFDFHSVLEKTRNGRDRIYRNTERKYSSIGPFGAVEKRETRTYLSDSESR